MTPEQAIGTAGVSGGSVCLFEHGGIVVDVHEPVHAGMSVWNDASGKWEDVDFGTRKGEVVRWWSHGLRAMSCYGWHFGVAEATSFPGTGGVLVRVAVVDWAHVSRVLLDARFAGGKAGA